MNTTSFWKDRPDTATLGPVLARPGKAPGTQEAVLRVVGSKDHISAILAPDGTLTIHATSGDPAPMFGIHQDIPPIKIRGVKSLLRWFSLKERKKRHVAKAIAAFSAKEAFRLTGVIAKGTTTPGTRIAKTLDEMHIAEAIALHTAGTPAGPLNTWRLLRWRDGPDPVQDWLFTTSDGTLIEVLGRPDTVLIRKPGAKDVTPYARADLTALRSANP